MLYRYASATSSGFATLAVAQPSATDAISSFLSLESQSSHSSVSTPPGLTRLTRIGFRSSARPLLMPCNPVVYDPTTVQLGIGCSETAPVVNVIDEAGPGERYLEPCFA